LINNNTQKLLTTTLALVLIVGFTSPVFADSTTGISDTSSDVSAAAVITINTKWYEFKWTTNGADVVACSGGCLPSITGNSVDAPSPAWTFTCPASGCVLTVTDAFNRGEQFEVYDSASSIGTTSAVPIPLDINEQCNNNPATSSDPEACVTDALASHGTFNLTSGSHSITMKKIAGTTDFPIDAGAAYFLLQENTVVAGDLLPLNTTALFISGITSSIWMIPTLAGIAGAGVYFIRSRTHEEN